MTEEYTVNKIGVLNFILIWFFFYIELLQGGIVTHDELMNIVNTITGDNTFSLSARWGLKLFHYPLDLLQNSMPNYTLYRLWTVVGLMIACLSIMRVIYHHVDQKLCWAFPGVFVLLAQITFEHNGLLSFGWGYQLDIALVFASIDCFILYKKTQNKKYKALSVVTYFVATMSYEAFAIFGAFLLLIDIIYMYSKKILKFRELVNDLIVHFFAVFVYTVSFVVLSMFYDAGDASIGNDTSIIGCLRTLESYSIGLFPLRFTPYTFKELLNLAFDNSWKNLILWIIIIIFVTCIIGYLQKINPISFKTYIVYSALSLLGMILPNFVVSMTSKFQQWTLSANVRIFGTSYYSYFFLIFWILVTVAFLYNRIKFKKSFVWVIFWLFVFISRFTLISNDYYLDKMNQNQNRYEAFMDIIESEYFSELPENVQIYTDDYVGVHYNMEHLSNLATSVSGNRVRLLNDKTQLDWSGPVYYLDYDLQVKSIYLFEMMSDKIANNAYILSKNALENYYCMFRSYSYNAVPTYVDGKLVGAYSMNAVIPTLYTESNGVLIQHEGIDTESFEIQLGYNNVDSSIISYDGIYGLENWGRWSQQSYSVVIDNVNNKESCELTILLAPGVQTNTKLNIEYNEQNEQHEIQVNGTELHLFIPLDTGINKIKFSSEAENLDVPGDDRNLNMQIFKLDVNYDGNVYSVAH